MIDVAWLLVSLGIILLGAEFFTNSIEWLGKKLNLSEGAVGSILAAVGTALPESMIPIIAILFGAGEAGEEIGIGAILGAPFMLSTLAFFIAGMAVVMHAKRRPDFPSMNIDPSVITRDLGFFLLVYAVAVLASLIRLGFLRMIISLGLVAAYAIYAYQTVNEEKTLGEEHDLSPLFFQRNRQEPDLIMILVQVLTSLAIIVGGAHLFVRGIEHLAVRLGTPPFVLSLIIAPVATELPEKFNSIIWIGKGKDTLALGNITGAMVFQSSLIPALGITLTEWKLSPGALVSAILALTSTAVVYWYTYRKKRLTPFVLMWGGLFYLVFIVLVLGRIII
ncbi:sodium:calcium antiporter [Calderihabitans maritimus]|uniref:Sodium/calcium exchanger membrane region n=1 Tax=Calderihabitans maritimus TaxID=1246530 RepID=A0A1Z5HUJ6_9FIRM|nr:sodium:calcium antiporter [Calderihabitans maritimus]GAW93001.1 Sodium/calcium exchanger membrane region [Calderihabitans maritimus]